MTALEEGRVRSSREGARVPEVLGGDAEMLAEMARDMHDSSQARGRELGPAGHRSERVWRVDAGKW